MPTTLPVRTIVFTQIEDIRRQISQGLAEIERGEASDYEGQKGLRRIFDEVRAEAYKNLLDKRRKKAKL